MSKISLKADLSVDFGSLSFKPLNISPTIKYPEKIKQVVVMFCLVKNPLKKTPAP